MTQQFMKTIANPVFSKLIFDRNISHVYHLYFQKVWLFRIISTYICSFFSKLLSRSESGEKYMLDSENVNIYIRTVG